MHLHWLKPLLGRPGPFVTVHLDASPAEVAGESGPMDRWRSVRRDLEKWIARVAPEDASAYEHDDEGIDDMPAHLRSAMTRTSEVVPVTSGRLALGTWQAIYVWEHRRSPHVRRVVVHVQGI